MSDFKRLVDEVSLEQVLAHLHIETKKKGNYYFLECPAHDHYDKHATNCYFKPGQSFCYCAACQKSFNSYSILLETGMDKSEATNTLWELAGEPEWFRKSKTAFKKKRNYPTSFDITYNEAELIGVKLPGSVKIAQKISKEGDTRVFLKQYKEDATLTDMDPNLNISSDIKKVKWSDFMSKKEFAAYIEKKCREKQESIVSASKDADEEEKKALRSTWKKVEVIRQRAEYFS